MAKLPTIVYVYGGPGVQLVRNAYAGTSRGLLFSFLARCGFNVVTIDGRGSAGRGALFEGAIKNRVGTIEIDDQVEGLEHLIAQGMEGEFWSTPISVLSRSHATLWNLC